MIQLNLMVAITSAELVTIVALGIALLVLMFFATLYSFLVMKRFDNAAKKIDYFFEDIAYKSEMLNSSVETISKLSNYIDVLDAFTKRNLKSWVKVATKNKDIVYKLVDKLREFANSED